MKFTWCNQGRETISGKQLPLENIGSKNNCHFKKTYTQKVVF